MKSRFICRRADRFCGLNTKKAHGGRTNETETNPFPFPVCFWNDNTSLRDMQLFVREWKEEGKSYAIYNPDLINGGGFKQKAEEVIFRVANRFPDREDCGLSRYVWVRLNAMFL